MAIATIGILSACASPANRAPVEDRASAAREATLPAPTPIATTSVPGLAPAVEPSGKPLPGSENAGKPGYYSVKRGDTLYKIAQQHSQNWRDIARWSALENPSAIEIGQVLRVVPPTTVAGTAVVPPPPASVTAASAASAAAAAPAASAASAQGGVTKPVAAAPQPEVRPLETRPLVKEGDDDIDWMWPASGPVVAGFDDVKSKGLSIAGTAGDPVLAAADGRVVYAGAGLRGYGNLVIVKHNATYLTAYAHNQSLLVKEDQVVLRGQKIAVMGSSDSDRVQLHFEIRRQGKPIDPAKLLPPR